MGLLNNGFLLIGKDRFDLAQSIYHSATRRVPQDIVVGINEIYTAKQ